jgi:hypothetical protein
MNDEVAMISHAKNALFERGMPFGLRLLTALTA